MPVPGLSLFGLKCIRGLVSILRSINPTIIIIMLTRDIQLKKFSFNNFAILYLWADFNGMNMRRTDVRVCVNKIGQIIKNRNYNFLKTNNYSYFDIYYKCSLPEMNMFLILKFKTKTRN